MRLLNRYLFSTIFSSVLMVLMVICALDLLAKFIDELDSITERYTFFEVMIYVSLNIPVSIYRYMPFAALVGGLIGLGSLAATSELITMRAAGVSLLRITLSVLKPILLLVIVVVFLAEYVIPAAEQYAENRRSLKLEGVKSALSSRSGLWNREGNEFMHFNSVQAKGQLLGITRYRFNDNNQLQATSFAKSAIYINGAWQEEGITETVITENGTKSQEYLYRPWNVQLSPALLAILVQDSDNLSISKLYYYINYLQEQSIDSGRYQLSFWSKVLQPFAIISLVLIAVSFIFGPLREVTMGYRIFSGVVVGIVFQLTQKLLGPVSLVYGFSPLIAVLIPITVCFFLGFFLLFRNR
ncbi:MAG: lipopolysaccharide export system permease protein [Cellvibrionaceae bacterium]|jgi:lipopolysaccharide export system permease protein